MSFPEIQPSQLQIPLYHPIAFPSFIPVQRKESSSFFLNPHRTMLHRLISFAFIVNFCPSAISHKPSSLALVVSTLEDYLPLSCLFYSMWLSRKYLLVFPLSLNVPSLAPPICSSVFIPNIRYNILSLQFMLFLFPPLASNAICSTLSCKRND